MELHTFMSAELADLRPAWYLAFEHAAEAVDRQTPASRKQITSVTIHVLSEADRERAKQTAETTQ